MIDSSRPPFLAFNGSSGWTGNRTLRSVVVARPGSGMSTKVLHALREQTEKADTERYGML